MLGRNLGIYALRSENFDSNGRIHKYVLSETLDLHA